MVRRYPLAMRVRPSFALLSALLLIAAGEAAAQEHAAAPPPARDRADVSAVAGARILPRAVRIVAAELERGTHSLPGEARLTPRPCDAGSPPGCRMIVIDLP